MLLMCHGSTLFKMLNRMAWLSKIHRSSAVCAAVVFTCCIVITIHAYRNRTVEERMDYFQPEEALADIGRLTDYGNSSDLCRRRAVGLSSVPLPSTGLVSYPGSGNTWTRHLIQQMTGIGTSSVYCDLDLRDHGFPFECHENREQTIVTKTHEPKHFHQFKRIVYLVRNPYDAILSYANYEFSGHTAVPSKQTLIQGARRVFSRSLRWYTGLTRNLVETFKGTVHIIQYERLKADMAVELRKLASFLGVNVSQRDIDCTVKQQEGNFHRRANISQHLQLLLEVYNKSQLLEMQEAGVYTSKLIKTKYDVDLNIDGFIENVL